MVNLINIFRYLLDKMSKFMKKQVILTLVQILSELFKTKSGIDSKNADFIRKCAEEYERQLKTWMTNSLSTGSGVPVLIPVNPDFEKHLSEVKPILESLSRQISFIEELIQKVSTDLEFSKLEVLEQGMIMILLAKSFLESRAVATIQRMINLGQNIRECLMFLEKYSEDFFKELDIDDFKKNRKDSTDFQLDSGTMRSFFETSAEYVQELTELQTKIEEIKALFSEIYSIESLFSVPDNLLSLSKSIQQLEAKLEQKTLDFRKFRETVVKFVEEQNQIRENLFYWVANDLPDQHIFYTQFNEIQGKLKEALKRIKC